VGFTAELLRTPMRASRLVLLLVVLVIFLFGTAPAIEPVASLGDSWLMAGFTSYILHHGYVLTNFDARFSWPGFFSLGSVLASFTGQTNALGFIRWFPLFIELMYMAPLTVIARFSGVSRRAAWLGVALFYSTNWIYQDYFSPQALNFLFFLVIIAAIMACWRPKQRIRIERIEGRIYERLVGCRAVFKWSRLRGYDAITVWQPSSVLGVLALVGLLSLASALSHQLTPYALILALIALLMTRRLGRPEIVVAAVLFTVGWLSLGASNYWIGHLSNIFGEIGQLGSTYGQNVSSRVTGSSSHLLVVDSRILLTALLYALAGVGFLRRSPDSRTLEALVGVPFLLLAAQSYGGEGLLRVVLYGLPFTSLLAASAILPNRKGQVRALLPPCRIRRSTRPILRVMVAVLLFSFTYMMTVVRGGNDAYEAFSTGELSAMNYAYAHIQAGKSVGLVAPYLPGGYRDIATVPFFIASDVGGNPTLRYDLRELLLNRPAMIILSQSQESWGEIVAGYPKGWETKMEASLLRNGYIIIASWPTATVLQSRAIWS
jgi:hypothetical protein